MAEISKESWQDSILDTSEVRTNLSQTVIITTEDKIKLCLLNHLKGLQEKNSWVTPSGLIITIILAFLTTNFKDWIFSKYVWQAFFNIITIAFFIWLIVAVIKAFRAKSIDDIIEEIKKTDVQKLLILEASYGLPGKKVDVKYQLSKYISNNCIEIPVNNLILGNAPDPVQGKNKILYVTYTHQGERRTTEVKEYDTLKLP